MSKLISNNTAYVNEQRIFVTYPYLVSIASSTLLSSPCRQNRPIEKSDPIPSFERMRSGSFDRGGMLRESRGALIVNHARTGGVDLF